MNMAARSNRYDAQNAYEEDRYQEVLPSELRNPLHYRRLSGSPCFDVNTGL
jgi:hypothetical protein